MLSDLILALITYLKDDSVLNAVVNERVFGGELPADQVASMPRKAIVVSYAGSPNAIGTGYQEYGDQRVDVRCYGETPKEASDVWRVVYIVLKNLERTVVNGTLLHWAKQAGGPTPLRDPDTDWSYIVSSWQVLLAEREVSA